MRDRNEWFKEVERAYLNLNLKTVNRPYEMPIEADVVEGEVLPVLRRGALGEEG